MAFIYHIYTIPETKHYFGKESKPGERLQQEVSAALTMKDVQPRLMHWLRKYLPSMNHEFVIESVEVPAGDRWQDHEKMVIWFGRQFFGNKHVTNIADGGEGGGARGRTMPQWSTETRARMSAAAKAKFERYRKFSPEKLVNISKNRGTKHKPETIAKMSAVKKAKWADPQERERLTNANRAFRQTVEGKALQSAASKARWAKYRAARSGDKH